MLLSCWEVGRESRHERSGHKRVDTRGHGERMRNEYERLGCKGIGMTEHVERARESGHKREGMRAHGRASRGQVQESGHENV